jgi:hypothetical protein
MNVLPAGHFFEATNRLLSSFIGLGLIATSQMLLFVNATALSFYHAPVARVCDKLESSLLSV